MMLQLDTSFMYASNLFCLKLIWFCLHRKGALGDDFLLEICWTIQFPYLPTGGNWKVLEDWSFWCLPKLYFRWLFLTKSTFSNSFEGHCLTVPWQCEWTCLDVHQFILFLLGRWYFGRFLLRTFSAQRVSNLCLVFAYWHTRRREVKVDYSLG